MWRSEEIFSPLKNCLNTHLLKSCQAAEASQHTSVVVLTSRTLKQPPFAEKTFRDKDWWGGGLGEQRSLRAGHLLCWNGSWWLRLYREVSKNKTEKGTQEIGRWGEAEEVKSCSLKEVNEQKLWSPQRGATELEVMGWWEMRSHWEMVEGGAVGRVPWSKRSRIVMLEKHIWDEQKNIINTIHSFIYSPNKYLMSSKYVPGTR